MARFSLKWHRSIVVAALMAFPASAFAIDISWNGFGSAYYGQALNKELLPYGFDSEHVNFTSFSLMGLNLGVSVEEHLDFAAQLVALGNPVGSVDKFGLIAQWAYVNYKPIEGSSIKLGRQLYPAILASEYNRVGYLLPFRQVPANIFLLFPFTRFDGLSMYLTRDVGIGKLTFGAFGGTPLLDYNSAVLTPAGLNFSFSDLLGAQVTLDGDGWRVRAQGSRFYSQLVTSAPQTAATLSGTSNSYSVGYRFDKYNIVTWGEYMWSNTPNGTQTPTGRYSESGTGYYVLGGYRIGNFLPRYTYSRGSENYSISTTPNGYTVAHVFGLNYQAGSQTVIKAEYEIDTVPSALGGGYFVTQPTTSKATSGSAFYAGVDVIF